MAQREGSIYLGLFVASFILFATMVVVVFILQGQIEELNVDLAQKDQTIAERDKQGQGYLRERNALRALIGGPDAPESWPGAETYQKKLDETEEQFRLIATEFNQNLSTPDYRALTEPYSDFVQILTAVKRAADAASNEAKTLKGQYLKKEETSEDQIKSLDEEKARLQQEVADAQARYEELDQSCRQEKEQLSGDLERLEEEIANLKLVHNRELANRENTIERLKIRLNLLRQQMETVESLDDIVADGEIIEVEPRSKIAWVNLGQTNHLQPGLVFRVFQYIGAKKVWKGTVEVSRVEEKISQVRIVQEESTLNPIAPNDKVASPFYDPKGSPVFVFAGETKRLDVAYIRQKLESFGAKVDGEVGVQTDFLVALENYQASPNFQAAKELGVPIMREEDLMSYLGR